jgi:hypothetical protein
MSGLVRANNSGQSGIASNIETIDSDDYVDDSIDTAHIAVNQVTLAEMAGITRGSIIYGDASGDPAALAKGTEDYVLTAGADDVAWAAAGSGLAAASVAEMVAASSTTVAATPGRTQNHPGVAKVWVKWEQDGAHGIIGSYNMTSVTDGSGAGDTDHLWNTDFAGTAYGFSAMGGTSGYFIAVTGATQASTGVTSLTTLHDGVATDRSANYLVAYGDQ